MKRPFLICILLIPCAVFAQRPFPNTNDGIYVFNDQLAGWSMSEAQFQFAATHYAGTQKMVRSDADRLRAYNPDFIILHYRLGLGLGYRIPEGDCQPSGEWIQIIEGDEWVQEWPDSPQENWFFHWNAERVFHCPWGWYLMELGNAGWRSHWIAEIIRQIDANDNDGLFADSYSVPNYLGAWDYDPPLPDVDEVFESSWSDRIESFTSYVTEQFSGQYYFLPNVGSWVTSRDATDYSGADGVMIEGFAAWDGYSPFDSEDWKLQMNRILSLTGQDKIIILQSYLDSPEQEEWRLFCLANYLLVKGNHSYINFEYAMEPEYFPEYDIDPGPPLDPLPTDIDDLFEETWGVYVRRYEKGLVLINPGTETTQIALEGQCRLVKVEGGGMVGIDGTVDGSLSYQTIDHLILQPFQGAILLLSDEQPSQVTGLEAFHRSGQTFITWDENNSDAYHVYRSTSAINADNLHLAALIAQIVPHSGYYHREVEECYDGIGCSPIGQSRFVIDDLGDPLPENTGLYVHTATDAGTFFYAVTCVSDGMENMEDFSGENSLSTGLVETVQAPEPVLVWKNADGTRRVYTHWMDNVVWNSDFEGAAYNFYIGTPLSYNGQTPFPLYFYLHAWGGTYRAEAWDSQGGSDYDWPVIQVIPDDRNRTWWYGFGDKAGSGEPLQNGLIRNYTEQRLLFLLEWLINRSPYNVDANRIYLLGSSMGASGALSFGLRHPEYIAAVFANEGMTDYRTALNWDFSDLWGTREQNIMTNEAMGVYDRLDLQNYAREHSSQDMPFLAWQHGIHDDVVPWDSQGLPFISAIEESHHGYVGQFFDGDHTWPGFLADSRNFNFEAFDFPRDKSFPAFSSASMSDSPSSREAGCRNCCLEWSSSVNPFAALPVDAPDRWEIIIRIIAESSCPDTGTVDLTPRRCQQFTAAPGCTVQWENIDLASSSILQSGSVLFDGASPMTFHNLIVSKAGNRFVLEKHIQRRKGDINLDGTINVLDVVRMVNIILVFPPIPNEYELWAADLNEDGAVNIIDAVWCVNLILNP